MINNNFKNSTLDTLIKENCNYDFSKGVYDFLNDRGHYSDSFFIEYQKHSLIQFDSKNKLKLSEDRFYECSNWEQKNLSNKNFLEVGSGGGRFTEIILKTSCKLYTIDSSDSIYVNFDNNKKDIKNDETFFIKCDMENFPFKENSFDYILCYGVLQNTKNPKENITNLLKYLGKKGKLSCDITKAKQFNFHLISPKYFWRNLTKRMNSKTLYKIVKFYVKRYYFIDTFLKKNFKTIGRIISKVIFPFPLLNYYYLDMDKDMQIELSVLDTFDALASKYDNPLTKQDINNYLINLKKNNTDIKKSELIETNDTFVINIEK
jgi:ubiquinone/menaquinone biosynthesis C-methylase UbiE